MTREQLPSEAEQFFGKMPLHDGPGGATHLPDHTHLYPADQPGNAIHQTVLHAGEDRKPVDRKLRFDALLRRLHARDIPGKEHVASYLHHQYRRNLRVNTIGNALRAITSFLELSKSQGNDYIEQITRSDLEAYIEHEQDRGLKASTVRHSLDTLKAFMRYLIEEQVVSSDILFRRMIIKVPDSLPKAMEIEDEKKLVCVMEDVRNRAMILLLLRTGMRIGELLSTRPEDIDLKDKKILIWESHKNRRGRAVYFTDDARDALVAWYERRDPRRVNVFYASNRDTLTYAAARAMFCKYITKAGLSRKGYTLHCLRHTNASSLLNAGMPLECLKELLGHQSVEVTRRYARLTNKTREKEYFKAMDRIERGEIDGHYKLDRQLQKILEKTELLTENGSELHE